MKRKWIETGQNLLIILLNHLVIISFGVTAMGMLKQDTHKVWLWSILLIIPLLFYWAKLKISNFFLFYALHLAVPIGIIFLPIDIVAKFLMIGISFVYFVWSVKMGIIRQGHGEGVVRPVFMAVTLGVMVLIETFFNQKGWEVIYITMAIIYAAGYCMYLFISRYLRFLIVNESSVAYIPEEEIFNKGFCQSFMYIAGVVTLLVLTAKMDLFSYIDSWIISGLRSMFRKIFSFLFFKDDKTEELDVIKPAEQDMEMLFDAGAGDPALFWEVLEKIAKIGVVLFIVGLVVFGIVKGFQYLWKEFYKDSSNDEKKTSSSIDIRETCTIEKTKKEGSNWFSFLNNREKIRKIYRKQVLKNKTAIIGDLDAEDLKYMTAKECCDKFAAEQLKKMYEKARYSAEEIVSSDVREAKSGGR